MEKARAEEAAARQRAAVAAKQLEEEERELASLRAAAAELAEAETQYWHDLNDFQMQFQAHADDRTAILRRVNPVLLGRCMYSFLMSDDVTTDP